MMDIPVPSVVFRGPDGRRHEVAAGGLIGRLAGAALRIDNPRVSEAHALVSLRGHALILLALRGGLAVGGRVVAQLLLQPGAQVALAEDLILVVERVHVPPHVLALRLLDGRLVPLLGEVISILLTPEPDAVPRFEGGAAAHLWSTGSGWRYRVGGEERARELRPHQRLHLQGKEIDVVEVDISEIAIPSTRLRGRVHPNLRLRPHFTGVRIEMGGRPPVLIKGVPGRILSELCEFSEPVEWTLVAAQVWPDELDSFRLRRNWDRNLSSLRLKLTQADIRQDLVMLDGHGNVGLHLLQGDIVDPGAGFQV